MIFPPEFIRALKDRAGSRCECERSECHKAPGRCSEMLTEADGLSRWTPVRTGERVTFPPVPIDYIALCDLCAVPRNAPR